MADIAARAYAHMAPWSAAQIEATLAQPQAMLTTTDHAYVLGLVIADQAEILALATDPAFQRRGQATRALLSFHDAARRRGAGEVFLEVAAANDGARAFYAGQGYAETGLRKGYYRQTDGRHDDAVIMSRALPSRHRHKGGDAVKTG